MLTVKHLITGHEVLPNGKLKPSAMLKMMQDAATLDASTLGCDYASMREDNLIFVISKVLVEYIREPQLDEEISVRTWNGAIQGVSFCRDFVLSVDSEIIGKATSRWVLVTYNDRRIARPSVLKNSVLTNTEEVIGISPNRRISLPDTDSVAKRLYRPMLTDLDTNYHVNNTRYADFLIDCCDIDVLKKRISRFEIHFQNELRYSSPVEFSSINEGDTVYVVGNDNAGRPTFSACIDFQEMT